MAIDRPYTAQTWTTGDVITKDKLKNIEDAIAAIDSEVTGARGYGASSGTLGKRIDDLVMIQDEQPTSANNKIWVRSTGDGVQVPTYEEFQNLENSVGEAYSSNKTYEVGDYVIYEDKLYRCTTHITTPEAWNASHWTVAPVGDELVAMKAAAQEDVDDLKSAFNEFQEGKNTLASYAHFTRGRLISGNLDTSINYRVATNDIISFSKDITVTIASGYRFSVSIFINGVFDKDVQWKTDTYTIPANTSFRAQIALSPDDTSVTADIETFVNAVYFKPSFIVELEASIDSVVTDLDTAETAIDNLEDAVGNIADLGTPNVVAGKYARADEGNVGKIRSSASYSYVLLPVVGGCTYLYKSGATQTQAGAVFYKSFPKDEGDAISGVLGMANAISVTVPKGALYGVFSYRNDKISDAEAVVKLIGGLSAVINAASENTEEIRQYCSIDAFETIACLGDSFTRGGIYRKDNTSSRAKKPYPEILAARHGMTVDNYGWGGTTVRTYRTNTEHGLPMVLNESAHSLYILSWGINDSSVSTKVPIADDTQAAIENVSDTFQGNYGAIINALKMAFPLARIVVFAPWRSDSEQFIPYINAAEEVAAYFGIPFCNPQNDVFFSSKIWNNMWNAHPSQVAYSGMALAVERLLAKTMADNLDYFMFANIDTPGAE